MAYALLWGEVSAWIVEVLPDRYNRAASVRPRLGPLAVCILLCFFDTLVCTAHLVCMIREESRKRPPPGCQQDRKHMVAAERRVNCTLPRLCAGQRRGVGRDLLDFLFEDTPAAHRSTPGGSAVYKRNHDTEGKRARGAT